MAGVILASERHGMLSQDRLENKVAFELVFYSQARPEWLVVRMRRGTSPVMLGEQARKNSYAKLWNLNVIWEVLKPRSADP